MKRIIKIIIIPIIIALSIEISFSQVWTEVQTPFKYVNRIKFFDDGTKLFVSGDTIAINFLKYNLFLPYFGSGFAISENNGQSFSDIKMNSYTVFDIYRSIVNTQTYFVSAAKLTRSAIYRSTDGGNQFDELPLLEDANFYNKIVSKVIDGKETFFICAYNTSDGLSISTDNCETATTTENIRIQVNDIKISKSGDIFLASDNSIYGRVLRSTDNGKTWIKDQKGLEGLRILCVQPSNYEPAYIYCGADSLDFNKNSIGKGIYVSLDTGKTWKPLGISGAPVLAIEEHPTDPHYMAAACGVLGVGVSANFGQAFEFYNDGLPPNAFAEGVAIPAINPTSEGIEIFANLYQGGLYKSKNIKSGVNDEFINTSKLKIDKIYPNPASEYLTISFNNPKIQDIDIQIIDLLGNTIQSMNFKNLNEGINVATFENIKIPSGYYFIIIKSNYSHEMQKFMILN
ncbi:MAG TPA: T9SS type A sorting domain-containing protein [Candidatus Kapabacteria bacterium]|nr:T9SS type A sorting domain-containing protein [Candidatus Kapabacteria bacterium]